MNLERLLSEGDAVSRLVALVLLAMSISSWAVIVWKGDLLRRALRDVARTAAAFWQAPDWTHAQAAVQALDRMQWLSPLIDAAQTVVPGTLGASGDREQQYTRVLRDALHGVLRKLQVGQVLLATVGSTAPFVGLLGTVWGIYHALQGITGAGQVSIERVSGPVSEALVMTAAGLAVAIPAVLGYNLLGRAIARLEADLEGFAHDLRALWLSQPA